MPFLSWFCDAFLALSACGTALRALNAPRPRPLAWRAMLRFPLVHPPLLAALAACGHGGKVLLADANYSHGTNVYPDATTIYLNLRPGLLTVHQVLEPLLQAVPVEAADVMTPGDGTEPDVFAVYRELLGPPVPLRP